jgi:hypothetical protein
VADAAVRLAGCRAVGTFIDIDIDIDLRPVRWVSRRRGARDE